MAVTAQGTPGTQTAVVGTEHTLLDVAVAGTFTLHVDTVNMAAQDVLELRIYQLVVAPGTLQVAYVVRYEGAQFTDDRIKISVPISNELTAGTPLRFTLRQTFGVGRDYYWKVLRYA